MISESLLVYATKKLSHKSAKPQPQQQYLKRKIPPNNNLFHTAQMPTNIKKEGNFDLFMSCNSIFSQHTFIKLLSKFEMHV